MVRIAALATAVGAISLAAIFFRKAAPTHPLVAAGMRLAIATLLLAPFVVRARRRGQLEGQTLRAGLLAGLAYAVHFGAWVTSLSLTTVAASVTLVTATPVVLALVGLLRRTDAPDRRHGLSLVVAAVGLSLIGGTDDGAALTGDGLALLGAIAMAGYMLVVRSLAAQTETFDSWAFMGIATAVGSVCLLGAAFALGIPVVFAGWAPFGFIVLAALLPQLVGHGLITWSLHHTRPTVVALATLAEPVGSTLLAWLWLSEQAGPVALLGCGITVSAVALAIGPPRPAERPVAP